MWDAYLEEVDKLLQKHKYEARVGPARDARLERLRSYYPALKDSLTNELDGVLPGFDEFKDLPAVKELWEGEDAQLDDSAWPTQVAVAEQALRDFAEEMRVHAIRIILAADSGGALTRLKADSPKIKSYPAKKYGAGFFTCITSQFICSPSGSSENVIAPYPSVLEHKPAGKGVVFFLESGLSFKAVCALRAILVAAELDEDTATPGDLDKLGRAFSWPECPKKCCKSRTWLDMVRSPPLNRCSTLKGLRVVNGALRSRRSWDTAPPSRTSKTARGPSSCAGRWRTGSAQARRTRTSRCLTPRPTREPRDVPLVRASSALCPPRSLLSLSFASSPRPCVPLRQCRLSRFVTLERRLFGTLERRLCCVLRVSCEAGARADLFPNLLCPHSGSACSPSLCERSLARSYSPLAQEHRLLGTCAAADVARRPDQAEEREAQPERRRVERVKERLVCGNVTEKAGRKGEWP